jgi:hypothetical protein
MEVANKWHLLPKTSLMSRLGKPFRRLGGIHRRVRAISWPQSYADNEGTAANDAIYVVDTSHKVCFGIYLRVKELIWRRDLLWPTWRRSQTQRLQVGQALDGSKFSMLDWILLVCSDPWIDENNALIRSYSKQMGNGGLGNYLVHEKVWYSDIVLDCQ